MRKKYQKPNMEMVAFETSYGVLDDIISKEITGGEEGNPSSGGIRAKRYNGWQTEIWEESEAENE